MTGFFLFGLESGFIFQRNGTVWRKIVATWIASPLFFAKVSFYYWPTVHHARRHPTPLISLSLFKTRTFSLALPRQPRHASGDGLRAFLMPLMLQVGFGCPALIATGCMMAPTALGSIIAEIDRNAGFTTFGIPEDSGRHCGIYRSDDCPVFVSISPAMPIWMSLRYSFLEWRCPLNLQAMNTITLADHDRR